MQNCVSEAHLNHFIVIQVSNNSIWMQLPTDVYCEKAWFTRKPLNTNCPVKLCGGTNLHKIFFWGKSLYFEVDKLLHCELSKWIAIIYQKVYSSFEF